MAWSSCGLGLGLALGNTALALAWPWVELTGLGIGLALRDGALAFALALEPLALLVVNIPGSAPGPDLLLLSKLHDIRPVDSQEKH